MLETLFRAAGYLGALVLCLAGYVRLWKGKRRND